ncbi:hypothetical protein AAFP30_15315 [Gordonia sp. CPCC 205515]|uniref:hypothetical protein n=1 Tax=Gordonia sp. CPCC 205515 TaxID=3140791 RepID=UPI003AF3F8EB
MTVADTVPAPPARGPRWRERFADNPGWVVTRRWLLVLAATVVAFWSTLAAVVYEMRAGTLITYLPAAVVLVVIAATGIAWRRGAELPIRDRQTDVIVGIIVLIIAGTLKVMNLRYVNVYMTTHIDLLAMWMFLLGSCCLAFGLRPVARYRWAWLLLLMIFPLPYRLITLTLYGGPMVAGGVMVVFGAVATAVAGGRTRTSALVGAAISFGVGLVILVAVRLWDPAAFVWYQTLPAVGASLVASALLYVDYRRRHGDSWSPLGRPMLPTSVAHIGRPMFVIIVMAVGLFFVPVPAVGGWPNTYVSGLNTRPPLIVPEGWVQGRVSTYDWVSRLYRPGATMVVQDLHQAEGGVEFDKFARPRKVVANSIETAFPTSLEVYPVLFIYDLVGNRFSKSVPVQLPHGVTGYLQTVVNDTNYLTYNRIYWDWTNGTTTQQVTLVSVDDHDDDAPFPSPDLTVARNLNSFFTVLGRGNSVIIDLEPQFKDRDLLVDCATDLINAQVAAIGKTAS